MGTGATSGLRGVKWGVAGNIAWAWVLTLPAAAAVAALVYVAIAADRRAPFGRRAGSTPSANGGVLYFTRAQRVGC